MTLFQQLRRISKNSNSPSRRDILAAALSASGGLLLQDRLSAAASPRKRRVVIVGAGFSGLACADELAFAGYDVTVVEARNRIGGRVITRSDVIPGKTVEGGGELIGPNQPTWMAYASRFSLTPLPFAEEPDDTAGIFDLNGKVLSRDAAKALATEVDTALRRLNRDAEPVPAYSPWEAQGARNLDKQSFEDWILRQDVSELCKLAVRVKLTAINGVIPAWQSYLANLSIIKGGGLDKFWDETDTLHVLGGTQQLANRLADSLRKRNGNDAVQVNQPVHAVRIRKHHVEVDLPNRTLEADDVVVTAPPSVLNKIAFTPSLPPGLVVPMANSIKYIAITKGRPWAEAKRSVDALSDGPVQMTWETTAGQGNEGEHGIVAYSSSREANVCRSWIRNNQTDANYEQHLKRFWGNGFELERGVVFDWLADPYSRGSYSFPSPGQVTVAGPLLTRGIGGRIHFAGEHCCFAFIGWMEGGLSSGVRVARRLAERDGLVQPLAR